MRIGVKICGISTEPSLQACIDADVDWVGFVFFARSPRCVTPAQAARLANRLPGSIKSVGLFVAPTDAEIDEALLRVPLAALQLYDRPERIEALRTRLTVPVWHALPIAAATDLPLATGADGLVIEGRSSGSDRPGGNGAVLDWSLFAGWRPPAPWLLAGGLRPDTVSRAIRLSGATAVDVSSGVESSPGVKDAKAIAVFTNEARTWEEVQGLGPELHKVLPVQPAARGRSP